MVSLNLLDDNGKREFPLEFTLECIDRMREWHGGAWVFRDNQIAVICNRRF